MSLYLLEMLLQGRSTLKYYRKEKVDMFVEVANTLKKVADGVKNINDESAEDKEKTNKE